MVNKLPLIHLICDYGTGDLAFSEVLNQLKYLLPQVEINPLSTQPFSTLNTGFLIAQLALYGHNRNIFIFSNTAPRLDKKAKRKNNAGEKFKLAVLDNGIKVAAADAGFCFSFVKPHIKKFYSLNVNNHGSQFRSRDFYPQAVADILNHKTKIIGSKLLTDQIPDAPKNLLMHVDGYGNMKTTIRQSEVKLKPNQKVTIIINQQTHQATYTDGSFSVPSGNLAFAPGSSGGLDSFMEIFLRGSSAHNLFKNPQVEAKITSLPSDLDL